VEEEDTNESAGGCRRKKPARSNSGERGEGKAVTVSRLLEVGNPSSIAIAMIQPPLTAGDAARLLMVLVHPTSSRSLAPLPPPGCIVHVEQFEGGARRGWRRRRAGVAAMDLEVVWRTTTMWRAPEIDVRVDLQW
jgi:hypothetical protein